MMRLNHPISKRLKMMLRRAAMYLFNVVVYFRKVQISWDANVLVSHVEDTQMTAQDIAR
jgi:hypothetical protein